jgi:hypothetical protein
MKLGDLVKVVSLVDGYIYGGDREADKRFRSFLHQTGRIVSFDTTECGATPKDPMIVVEFQDKQRDAFWSEELARIKENQ